MKPNVTNLQELSIERVSLDLPETLFFYEPSNKDRKLEDKSETMIRSSISHSSDSSFRPV